MRKIPEIVEEEEEKPEPAYLDCCEVGRYGDNFDLEHEEIHLDGGRVMPHLNLE